MGTGRLTRIAALTSLATASVMVAGVVNVPALVGLPETTVPSTTVTVPSTPVTPTTTVTTPTVTTTAPTTTVPSTTVTVPSTPVTPTTTVKTPTVNAPSGTQSPSSGGSGGGGGAGGGGGGGTVVKQQVSRVLDTVSGVTSGTTTSNTVSGATGTVGGATGGGVLGGGTSGGGTAGGGTAGGTNPALQALSAFDGGGGPGGTAGPGGSGFGGGSASGPGGGGGSLPPTLSAAGAKQLRAALELLQECMSAIAPLDRQVLSMRAGGAGAAPLSRPQVASQLGVSTRQVRLSERRGLSGLRVAAEQTGCAGPVGGPFAVSSIGPLPLAVGATTYGAVTAATGFADGGGPYVPARQAGPGFESPLARLTDSSGSGPAWLVVLVTILLSVSIAGLMRELRQSVGA
jgi:hypothetical protein